MDAAIYTALQSLFGGRVSPDVADFATPLPYCIYQQVGGRGINFIDAAQPGLRHARVQVSVWADSRDGARSLAEQVETAMRSNFRASAQGAAVSDHDEDLRRYGSRQDFSFYY